MNKKLQPAMRRNLLVFLGVIAVAIAAVCLLRSGGNAPAPASIGEAETTEPQATSRLIGEVEPTKPKPQVRLTAEGYPVGSEPADEPAVDAWVEELPAADRKLGQAIVDASDKEDLAALKKLVDEARQSRNPDVRQRMVESLGWFGKDAVVELSKFLTDANEDVSQSAFCEWDTAVDQVENEEFGVAASASAMKVLTNEDNLQCAAFRLESAENRKAALNAIADIAESGNEPGIKAAKEAYEFITGEDWPGPAQARLRALTINKEDE